MYTIINSQTIDYIPQTLETTSYFIQTVEMTILCSKFTCLFVTWAFLRSLPGLGSRARVREHTSNN